MGASCTKVRSQYTYPNLRWLLWFGLGGYHCQSCSFWRRYFFQKICRHRLKQLTGERDLELQGREHPVETWGSGGLDAYSWFLDICFDPPFQHAFHPVWPRKGAGDRRG